ncbi:hypothetical protein [Kitasatospora sp. NPDC088548]|uniref:hypothetical protein n=1 Tax=Kitasatospora sp. NPDC088548 TaxID=3364075 RepID=UPI0038082DEF
MLSSVMRARLSAAVRALLASPGLVGQSDAVRFAAVVLMARTPFDSGVVTIRKGELGRWCGSSRNFMKVVTRTLRGTGLPEGVQATVADATEDGSEHSADSLSLRVLPLWEAMTTSSGPAGRCPETGERNPLALDQRELKVLFHLVEYLFAPGWGRDSMVGLLASRTGRGAATDRLALLLLVLSASSRGRVRMCGGRVDTHVGRPAVTLARMLGCSPDGAAHVLARLEEAGVLTRPRRGAAGLRSRARLVIPSVAAAYKANSTDAQTVSGAAPTLQSVPKPTMPAGDSSIVPTAVPAAVPVDEQPAEDRWWETCGEPEIEEPPVADPAVDLEEAFEEGSSFVGAPAAATPGGTVPLAAEVALVSAVEEGGEAGTADLAASTPLHAIHSPVAEVGGCADEVDGLSGACAVGVTHRRPERAGAREDAASPHVPALRLVGAADPLRGEQPDHDDQHNHHQGQPEVRATPFVPLPRDAALACALAPVEDLWQRLERPSTRGFLLKRVRRALAGIAAWTGPTDAPEVLADRLAFRVKRQRRQGNPHIDDVVAWMLDRGLPQEQECKHAACDNGVRLDTDKDCVTCDLRLEDRRSTRRAIIGQVVRRLPEATFEQRREAIEDGLRSHALVRAEAQADAARRAAEAQALWEAQRPEREAAAAEAERERLAVPCADCGAGQAAGLCRGCAQGREIRQGTQACITMALAAYADLGNYSSVRRTWELTRFEVRQARQEARLGAADEVIGGASEVVAVQHALDVYRVSALRVFARSEAACEEAVAAYKAVWRARHRFPSEAAARKRAAERAEEARARAAEWLLRRRLAAVEQHLARVAARQQQGRAAAVVVDPNVAGRNRARAAVAARQAARRVGVDGDGVVRAGTSLWS